jgi:hypothetical protein
MATKDLAAKYGKSKNSKQLINAAIRAELVGGNETLEAQTVADNLMLRARSDRAPPIVLDQVQENLAAVQAIAAAMRAEIRKRYGMPPELEDSDPVDDAPSVRPRSQQ